MATLETQILDEVIVSSRRKMLALGGTALAGMFLASPKAANAATYSDADILNFALNLEYLEANFYYLCAYGTTINVANPASTAAGAPVLTISTGVTGGGSQGAVVGTGMAKVPFGTTASEIAIASYCNETALEEAKHVRFLQTALGSATAVVMPQINLGVGPGDAFQVLANAALGTAGAGFSPYLNSSYFLIGAYIFEDVGVTAYHGAAPLLTNSGNLSAAAGIMGVEAYHAGLVRTSIFSTDAANGNTALSTIAQAVSALRNTLSQQALLGKANTAVTLDPSTDDFGPGTFTPTTALGVSGVTSLSARIVDCDTTDTVNPIPLAIAFSRNTSQVLNIVTGGGAVSNAGTSSAAAISPAKGVFFPNGLNGLFR